MNDYLAKPIEEDKLYSLLLRYQPGKTLPPQVAAEPVEPPVNHDITLDWQLALRQAAMKPDLAREMLQMLLAFMPEVRNKVEEQLVGEQPEGVLDLIHKLHGSCSYSGVPRLKNCVTPLRASYARAPPPRRWSRSFWSCWMKWTTSRAKPVSCWGFRGYKTRAPVCASRPGENL